MEKIQEKPQNQFDSKSTSDDETVFALNSWAAEQKTGGTSDQWPHKMDLSSTKS